MQKRGHDNAVVSGSESQGQQVVSLTDQVAANEQSSWWQAPDFLQYWPTANDGPTRAASPTDKWKDFMENRSAIGMFTILYMHKADSTKNLWVARYLLSSVLFAQVVIPILVLWNTIVSAELTSGYPLDSSWMQRVTALAIGWLYQVRINFSFASKSSEPWANVTVSPHAGLRWCLYLDTFMNIHYELLVYCFNLVIVFLTSKPSDMVLNSLAFEFILDFDNVARDKYISIYKECDAIIRNYWESFEEPGTAVLVMDAVPAPSDRNDAALEHNQANRGATATDPITRSEIMYRLPFYISLYILPPILMIYVPVCKPK